jgi:predicted molibdopterin-dependent oxidoreductase YjgC
MFSDLVAKAKELRRDLDDYDRKSLAQVVSAMNTIDGYDYGGSWSSHWYECPNGHPYFIGNCGQAMETSRCIECGEPVGGNSHSLLSSNRTAGGS